ncbi:hypothetical protein F4861DRAFT_502398 [Xylaria intraflava]|nr:hypothetical protein F4861DRAFT_502398 [Xylaria intraflava]
MGETPLRTSTNGAVDAPHHERPLALRRTRLPDNLSVQPEKGAPPHTTGSMRKDSKIGLRGIFTRSRTGKADKDSEEDPSQITSRPTGIRASLADFTHWPSRFHSSLSVSETASIDSRSSDTAGIRRPVSSSRAVSPAAAALGGRVMAIPWNPPAFFQVYPQAVKHATLPVCKIPVETLARHSSRLAQGRRVSALENGSDFGTNTKRDMLKKKPRLSSLKNSREWTSKIFVLVTSGYLLQYAAEGTFDRMPEKILQLTATSAAYASDLVPGKHWVLQVTSTTDPNGNAFVDPKSRRLKHSVGENEHVSTMLLVLENAESMDDWLAMLRKEIEFQGGKKKVSETGQVETNDQISGRQAPPSHRTVITEDSNGPSRVITQDFSYTRENAVTDSTENYFATAQPNRLSIYTVDYVSPTASMVSSEGQRLDSLRDSSSSHRFSYVSSGQRTMITSADSSPACSPTRASFSSLGEDLQTSPKMQEVRLRPNASAIVNRRQSIQALISSFEASSEQYSNPYTDSTLAESYEHERPSISSVPNFSVPHAAGKRFSLATSASGGSGHIQQSMDSERSSKASRKPPPTALLMSRPLSIVIDQPSPLSPRSPKSLSRSFDSCESNPFQSNDVATSLATSPEKGAYVKASFRPKSAGESNSNAYGRVLASPDLVSRIDDDRAHEHMPRAVSSLDSYSPRRRLPERSPDKYSSHKRSSLRSETQLYQDSPYSSANVDEWKPMSYSQANLMSKSSCSPKRSVPSLRPSARHLSPHLFTTDSDEKAISTRRSMPHLTEGPPPAPPPNRALPPIPRKSSGAYHSVRF